MLRRSLLFLAGTLALAACEEVTSGPGPFRPYPAPLAQPAPLGGATPGPAAAGPAGGHVALLAPVTGANAERGQALVQAAQLALAAPGSPTLDVRDTGSTPQGAAAAAQAALAGGAGLIIGPLTAAETAAVAPVARPAGVAVLAFTNDPAQAQPGVWTLGLTPAQQVRRMVGALLAQGKNRVTAVLPPGDFGAAMAIALTQALAAAGAPAPDIHQHDNNNANIANILRDISGYASRRGPIDARIKADRSKHTAEARKEIAELSRQPIPPPPFDALLLADTGEKLAWEASFLGYYDISPHNERLLGPALWANPAALAGANLSGAWYAAPDPAARATFDAAYQAKYGGPAPGLADFAYDAAAIARVLATAPGGYSVASLCRPEGFAGVDGVLALQTDGTVRRGLAIFEIQHGGGTIVDPAPTDLTAPGI